MASRRALAAAVIAVIGILAVVVGVIYLTTEAKSLPSFMGHIHNDPAHRSLRGIVALVVGVLLIAGGLGLVGYKPRTTPA